FSAPVQAVAAVISKQDRSFLRAGEQHYGVYLNGQKVGWMRTALKLEGEQALFSQHLHAKISGMGMVSSMTVSDERSYSLSSGTLDTIRFSQEAATGRVVVEGRRQGKRMQLQIEAGSTR